MANKDDFQMVEHRGSVIQVARANNRWLGVVDLVGLDLPVRLKIKRVFEFKNAKFEKGRSQDGQAIEFTKTKKFLPLNKTNADALARHYGTTAEALQGKVIVLDVEPLERVFNGHTHGIRIQPDSKVTA